MPRLELPNKWDHETDILIIGAGTGGMPAGCVAVDAKNKATILEMTTSCGGSGSLIMGGAAWAGTDLQKKAGIQDSPEALYKDGVEIAQGLPESWRVYADNQLDTYYWLTNEVGATPNRPEFLMSPGHRTRRNHYYDGAATEAAIEKYTRRKGVEILLEHRALRLFADTKTDRVYGCQVNAKGKVKNFKAKKAIILATGGFGRNKELLKEYGVRFANCIQLMAPGHMGDGLKMALELGAATKDIGHAVVASLPADTTTHADRALFCIFEGGVGVNVNGKRFYDESCPKGYYGQFSDAGMDQPGEVYWIVYDSEVRKKPVPAAMMPKHKEFTGNTFEELGKAAGIDPKGFNETMTKYNSDIESEGYDTVFGRKTLVSIDGKPIQLVKPPFYAVKCQTSITSFKGGLRVNSRCQVMNQYSEVIPSLYAAGEVAGGLFGKGVYLGSTNWPSAMTFGRVAAINACTEKPWS
jgi:fumarate reductase flavoprotein subunit